VEKIQVPSNCPSCNSILEWVNDLLFCKNKDCSTKSAKKIQHFAKTLYIKGLGPRSIEKLGLNSAIDLYYLDKESASLALNSEKLGSKLIREIENSTTAPANLLLPAFSIPLVGRSAAEKLSVVCRSIFDITVLKSLGYVVKESVTNDVTILVNETGIETTKTLKALDKGIQIVTNLKDYIGERHGSSQVE